MTATDKTWLVLGASGFVGSHLVRHLTSSKVRVVALTRRKPADLPASSVSVVGDVADRPALAVIFESHRPDVVVHAVGRVSAPRSSEQLFFDDNLGLLLGVIDALRSMSNPARLVVVGSAAQYGLGTAEGRPSRETDAFRPVSAYGASKAAAMIAAMSASTEHGLDIVGAVPFNILGPRQRNSLVPATFIRSAIDRPGQTINVGSVIARRDFVDVRDVASAIEAIADRGRTGQFYNIGSGIAVPVGRILELVAERVPHRFGWVANEDKRGPIASSYADTSMVRGETGWKPNILLEQSIADMVVSMRGH